MKTRRLFFFFFLVQNRNWQTMSHRPDPGPPLLINKAFLAHRHARARTVCSCCHDGRAGLSAQVVGAAKPGHLLSGPLAEQVWQPRSREIREWTRRQDVTRLSLGGRMVGLLRSHLFSRISQLFELYKGAQMFKSPAEGGDGGTRRRAARPTAAAAPTLFPMAFLGGKLKALT